MLETVFLIVVVLSGYSIFLLTRFDEVKIVRRPISSNDYFRTYYRNSIQMSDRIAVNDSIQITQKSNSNNNNGIS